MTAVTFTLLVHVHHVVSLTVPAVPGRSLLEV